MLDGRRTEVVTLKDTGTVSHISGLFFCEALEGGTSLWIVAEYHVRGYSGNFDLCFLGPFTPDGSEEHSKDEYGAGGPYELGTASTHWDWPGKRGWRICCSVAHRPTSSNMGRE